MKIGKGSLIAAIVVFLLVIIVTVIVIILVVLSTEHKNNIQTGIKTKKWCIGDLYCNNGETQNFDVVIVGAGVSGLFCAARIKQFYPHKTILILEQGTQVGGRLESILIKEGDIYAEAGGMRFFPSVDKYTDQLVKDLQIKTVRVPYVAPENIVYLRGVRTRINDLPNRADQIFNLSVNEKGKESRQLVRGAIQDTLNDLGITLDQVRYNKYLLSITFKKMLYDKLTYEAIQYFSGTNGYNFTLDNISAATGIEENITIIPQEDSPQLFLKQGYQHLPIVLAERLKEKVGIRLQQQVEKFTITKGGNVSILIQPIKPRNIQSSIITEELKDGNSYVVAAKKLILAIPKNEMMSLHEWSPQVMEDFESILPWEGTKIFLEFSSAWWKRYKVSNGRSVTDIPMRQVWYWTEDPPILMVYCDNLDAAYWSSLLPDQIFPEWKEPSSAPRAISELKKQLSQMFGINEKELNVRRILWRFWPCGNYFWKPTEAKKEIQMRMLQPLGEGYPVFTVSDCWSNYQSWVNGALENADEVLKRWDIPSLLSESLKIE